MNESRDLKSWVWIVGLQLALVLPFIGQPFHLDDTIYLSIGRNVQHVPLQAMDFRYCAESVCAPDMASHSHPPFVGYFIGILMRLFGDGPRLHIALHLAFVVFPLLFAIGMYRLAQRFATFPILTTMLAIASPAAVVMSHNVMPDYPTLACWTMALALYINGVDKQKPGQVWLSAVFMTFAAFTSYPALLAAGLCWVYAWLKKSRMRAALLAPLIPIAWMAGWLAYSSWYFGRFILARTATYYLQKKGSVSSSAMTDKLLAFPIELAGTLIVLPPLVRAALAWFKGAAAIVWLLISIALTQFFAGGYATSEKILMITLMTVGGWMIMGLATCIWKSCFHGPSPESRQDSMFLTAWVVAAIPVVLFVYAYAAARYMMPLLPPLVLLTFSRFQWTTKISNWRGAAQLGLAASLVLGLSISIADYEMPKVHRDIARHYADVFKGWESRVRFGGDWGFREYMAAEGFRLFIADSDDLGGGQFIIIPRQADPYELPEDAPSMMVPVTQKSWESWIPLRTMNKDSHAGFYSSGWGLLPFSISKPPVEFVTMQQVNYLVEKLPEIVFEGRANQETPIPRPGSPSGIELVVPPGKLSIPYDGPLPAHVEFSCVGCSLRVRYESSANATDIALKGESGNKFSFDLPNAGPGMIVLEMDTPSAIRNWLMLPPGGVQ